MNESPVFIRTHDFLLWLIPQVQKFPRPHRFGVTERIQRLGLDLQDRLVAAGKSKGTARLTRLEEADIHLEQIRFWIRFASDMQRLTIRQYEHAARMMGEIGRLLGAWIKQERG